MDLTLWNSIALWIIASFYLILTLILVFVGIPAARDVRKATRRLTGTIDEVRVKLDPVLLNAQAVADDVQTMTATAREKTERMGTSVDHVSRRIDDLASLIQVVQEEIEKPFLKSAATIAGARRAISRFF